MTDPAEIARGLTKAQRRAFMAMPLDRPFNPLEYARQLPTIAVLRAKRLIRPERDIIDPWSPNVVTRPLGLAVRQHIKEADA